MGKSLPSMTRLQEFARIISSYSIRQRPKQIKPISRSPPVPPRVPAKPRGGRVESEELRLKMEENSSANQSRLPLAEVVSDCASRWFQDTLKEAKAGDSTMQVLVGQMYYSGYGVPRDAQKGRAWISRASKSRSWVWKVGDKHPVYSYQLQNLWSQPTAFCHALSRLGFSSFPLLHRLINKSGSCFRCFCWSF